MSDDPVPAGPEDEHALVARVRMGDAGAFERLYRNTYPTLMGVAVRVTGSRDGAADVVQDVFFTLWRTRATVHIRGSVLSYLAVAVRHAAANRRLADDRHQRRAERYVVDLGAGEPDRGADTEPADNTARVRAEQLTRAVDTLPPRAREAFVLSRTHGLTYGEIAVRLGISVKAVEANLARALKALRAAVGPAPGPIPD